MRLLADAITHGQAVALVLLCVFLVIFIIIDVYLVLSLRRKNKKLAKDSQTEQVGDNDSSASDIEEN